MRRLKNTEVVQKCNIYYDYDGTSYFVGTLSRECIRSKSRYVYVFDIDKESVDKLKSIDSSVNDRFIPGVDLGENGYYQFSEHLPTFIYTRVVDRGRGDIQRFLDMYNMAYYNAFEMFMRSEGRQDDNFHVEQIDLGKVDNYRKREVDTSQIETNNDF